MKKILLLGSILLGVMLAFPQQVKAQENFYEGEYINNIWMIRKKGNRLIYQTARFLRRSSDQQFAYCIEPFSFINNGYDYESTLNPTTISQEVWEQVSLIAYYGYGYQNHNANKWYPITQMLIWRTLDPTSDFYFTDSLNGNRIDIFQEEMNEILNLVQQHYKKPSFDNQTITLVLGNTVKITDYNNELNQYHLNSFDQDIIQDGNTLQIHASNLQEKTVSFNRNETLYQTPPILYYHPTSQNLMTVGSAPNVSFNLKINIIETNIKFHKIDKDNKDKHSQGQAQLEGAIYEIYNNNMELIDTITIDEEKQATIKNLDFGTYYLKEKTPGVGYQLDENTYEFTISKENPNIELTLENEVVKRKIEIYKKYGNPNSDSMKPEEGISFGIYDHLDNLLEIITTDSKGYAEVTLPFGNYTVKQINTTEGYQKIDDFTIDINETTNAILTYQLDNLKIPVPNTSEQKNSLFSTTALILNTIGIYYVTKKFYFFYAYTV